MRETGHYWVKKYNYWRVMWFKKWPEEPLDDENGAWWAEPNDAGSTGIDSDYWDDIEETRLMEPSR